MKRITVGVVCIVLGLSLLLLGVFANRLLRFPNIIEHDGVRISYYVVEEGDYQVFLEVLVSQDRRALLEENCSVEIAVLRWAKVKGWNVNRTQFSYLYLPVFLFGEYGSRRLMGVLADGAYYFGAVVDFSDTSNYWIVGGELMELEEWGSQGSIQIGEINIDFDLPITALTPPLPESFRECESRLFYGDERPLLKPKKVDVEVPRKIIGGIHLIWIGAALTIAGFAITVRALVRNIIKIKLERSGTHIILFKQYQLLWLRQRFL